jgi:glycerophosphoryl diester phosphodiesterase
MSFLRERLRTFSIALAVASSVATGCGDDDGGSSSQSVFFETRTLNIAHRGGARLWPEHTLLAYERALEAGADVIELDLHATSDGVIVALHDATVDRTTDGSGVVRNMTYDELRQLDAGYRFTRDRGATYPWRGRGLTIPTLDEALDLLGSTPMAIEIKQAVPPIAAEVLATFEAHGAVEHAIFVSFDRRPVETIRELDADALTAFSGQEIVVFGLLTEETLPAYVPPAPFMQPPSELVDATFIERANRLGLKVHAWTVNEREEMRRLIDLGVGGIFTDDPVLLAEELAADG